MKGQGITDVQEFTHFNSETRLDESAAEGFNLIVRESHSEDVQFADVED